MKDTPESEPADDGRYLMETNLNSFHDGLLSDSTSIFKIDTIYFVINNAQ
jgi:hypothetical protein